MIEFKGGRLAPDPSKPRLMFNRYLRSPATPRLVDYLSKIDGWPMYLNDTSATARARESRTSSRRRRRTAKADREGEPTTLLMPPTRPSPDTTRTTGANDNGARMQDVLSYWRKTGIEGRKILAFAQVDHDDLAQLNGGLGTFGALYVGINFPESAMTQFNEGKPWDVVPGARIEGGHAIHVGYYGPDDQARLAGHHLGRGARHDPAVLGHATSKRPGWSSPPSG